MVAIDSLYIYIYIYIYVKKTVQFIRHPYCYRSFTTLPLSCPYPYYYHYYVYRDGSHIFDKPQ